MFHVKHSSERHQERSIQQRVAGILACGVLHGGALMVGSSRPSLGLITVSAFLALCLLPIAAASSNVLWQRRTPADIQGRVFALRQFVCGSALPLAYLLAGPLADHLFEPLMASDGGLAPILGPVMGVGPGRGIALMGALAGLFTATASVVAWWHPRVRHLEREIPVLEPVVRQQVAARAFFDALPAVIGAVPEVCQNSADPSDAALPASMRPETPGEERQMSRDRIERSRATVLGSPGRPKKQTPDGAARRPVP